MTSPDYKGGRGGGGGWGGRVGGLEPRKSAEADKEGGVSGLDDNG